MVLISADMFHVSHTDTINKFGVIINSTYKCLKFNFCQGFSLIFAH